MTDERIERFDKRQAELQAMSDEQLKERFWALAEQLMDPVVDLARTHTSSSIERSVLLRMGIDSVSTHGVVDKVTEAGLLGKGAGHCVLKVAHKLNVSVREAAQLIISDPSALDGLFDEGTATPAAPAAGDSGVAPAAHDDAVIAPGGHDDSALTPSGHDDSTITSGHDHKEA